MQMGHVEFSCHSFFLRTYPVGLLLVCISTNYWSSDSFLVYSMSLVLSVGYAFVDECGPFLLLSAVLRISFASHCGYITTVAFQLKKYFPEGDEVPACSSYRPALQPSFLRFTSQS